MIGFFVGIADYSDVKDKIDQVDRLGGSGSVGPAMLVCVIGGVITMVFARGGVPRAARARDRPGCLIRRC